MAIVIKIEKYHYVALIGWIAKIFTVIFSLINTRMLLDIIGVQGFALYSIIFSLAGWLSLLNFAIPSALQNVISKFKIEKKDLKELFQTILFVVITIIILSIPILFIVVKVTYNTLFINYHNILHIDYLLIMLFLLFLFGLSEIFNKVLFSLHKGYLPNTYPALISIFAFLMLYLSNKLHINNVNIVLILFFLPYLCVFILSYVQSISFVKPKFNKHIFYIVLKLAKKFFLFTILAAFVLKVDYIIMSMVLKAHEIAIYNLDMRIFNLVLFMYGTILAALWPVSSELFHKKDFSLIKKNIKKNILFGIILTTVLSGIIILLKDKIFFLISGDKSLNITFLTGILTSIYIMLRIWTDSFATILQSMNEINILIYIVPVQAFISILAQYYLGLLYGLNGILIGLILSFLLTVVWVLPIKFYKITKEKI
jgi:O-antigen/teichoic acid export membrane protein